MDAGPALGSLAPMVHRLDRNETRAFLAGRISPGLWESPLPKLEGWGLWKDEDDLTFQELWRGLETGDWLRFHRYGPWRGLLAPLPSEKLTHVDRP